MPLNPTTHKSKTLSAAPTFLQNANGAGFKGPAKRSAFGDLSNTAGHTVRHNMPTNDLAKNTIPKPAATAKLVPYKDDNKENAIKKGKNTDALHRPAQRPSIGLKPSSNSHALAAQHDHRAQPVIKQTVARKPTVVYSDEQQQRPQSLSRQYRSQPHLKSVEGPVLRRTQSKHQVHEEYSATTDEELYGEPYEDALEELPREEPAYVPAGSGPVGLPGPVDPPIAVDTKPMQPVAAHSMHAISSGPLMPEPEESWDEDDEDDLYDEQGYTTAHSMKSYGDNTLGATALLAPKVTSKVQRELEEARQFVDSTRPQEDIDEEEWDVSMVAEYGEEIFQYMRELEVSRTTWMTPVFCCATNTVVQHKMLPNPHYMDEVQAEIQWSMRSILMDWLVQVHNRFALLPETLFLTVNYIDRFLSSKMVSLGKLQLVGATAIFVAAKYEEINCPSVQEIVFMVDGGYTVDEILKAERFMLSMLQFELGWPGPMSFLRRISKADDYDLETRTLAKYFLEVTIMDERFVGCPPSYLAAGAHCLARLILKKGDWVSYDPIYGQSINVPKLNVQWTTSHVHYSGYTWAQIKPLVAMVLECCRSPQKHHSAVYEKYCDRRFKKSAVFVEEALDNGFELPFHNAIPRLSLYSTAESSAPMRFPPPENSGVSIPIES